MTHPAINEQILKLIEATLKAKARGTIDTDPNAKLLSGLSQLMFTDVPGNPAAKKYRQGKTLGSGRKHWFRAKFGRNRFRLFYRYSSTHKTIIYAWVNDSNTLSTYSSKKDAYAVFKGMLDDGNPSDDWDDLMNTCALSGVDSTSEITRRIEQALTDQE
ncbi:toxin YhaV [Roseovarius lutimaris]|uniref:Toxin YhaV n=1 Tax=Roseovarius lutimaris TaxID=1005928 RepID=A0A1I5GKN8_9RHOB|nr:type II toxin-antitoxin system YhaV family toxin [Roseovarius lutimaris]SFO36537.1 toxin YhaV [Roseovarius lutimaris]